METDDKIPAKVELVVPLKTYLTFCLVAVVVFILIKVAPVLVLLFLSLLCAVTLNSLRKFLVAKGWRRGAAEAVLIATLIGTLVTIFFFIIPTALGQMKGLFRETPRLQEEFSKIAPKAVQNSAGKLIDFSEDSTQRIWDQAATIANHTLTSMFQFALMMIAAIYMFLDGDRTYQWILAFFSKNVRARIDQTSSEISPIVESYIIGQATTSTLASIWVFTSAELLHIPGALTLAVLAAFFDILPGIGFLLTVFTGGLLALTVSTETALFLVISLGVYSALENYVLIPYIYGRRLKLSPLVVLISLILSGSVAGLPGMIAILPIVAAYGPIERLWLKRNTEFKETVELHQSSDP